MDGKNWRGIRKVAASGESRSVLHYTFTDENPSVGGWTDGENLYRLKIMDMDDTFAYSGVRSLRFENSMRTILFPNPVADKLEIRVDDWNNMQLVEVINSRGATIYESTPAQLKGIPANGIDARDFPIGSYIVKITDKNGFARSARMIKY